jgi:hypothetical protein
MGANLVQAADGSASFDTNYPGQAANNVGFLPISSEYIASSVDKVIFVASRAYAVKAIRGRVTVAGTDGSAVTATVRKVASGTAITSGTALHSGTFNLKGTADTNQSLTLSATASDLLIAPGEAIAIDFAGTLTSATGVITVELALV